jgi:undecaprenyl-diphosphatase
MIDFLLEIDRFLLIKINSWHAPWLDSVMITLTNGLTWLPLFLLVIGMMIYKFRWQSLVLLVFIGIVIFLTDRISAGLIKPWVGRLRPSHETDLEGLLHLVNNYKGGLYSFVSSHAANAFGIATFLWLTIRKRIGWIWIMFVWAIVFSYTRIYLGVHYPFDILGGAILGMVIGLVVYMTLRRMPPKINPITTIAEQPS